MPLAFLLLKRNVKRERKLNVILKKSKRHLSHLKKSTPKEHINNDLKYLVNLLNNANKISLN